MQERATTLQSVVDKVVVTLDEHSIILDEIRESLKVISGKSKGISTDSTLTEPQSQQVHQSGGQSGVFQPSFNTVRNPPFTPPLAPINIPATMHSPSQFQPSVYPANQAAFSTSQNAFTVDNPPGIRTLLCASLILFLLELSLGILGTLLLILLQGVQQMEIDPQKVVV